MRTPLDEKHLAMAKALGFNDENEFRQFVDTLEHLDFSGGKYMPPQLFHPLVSKMLNLVIERITLVKRSDGRWAVALAYREDYEFTGHHVPGSVFRTGQSTADKCREIEARELNGVTASRGDMHIGTYEHIVPLAEIGKPGSHSRIHEYCLIYARVLDGEWSPELEERVGCTFFPIDEIPSDTLLEHKQYIQFILKPWIAAQELLEESSFRCPAGFSLTADPIVGSTLPTAW